LFVVCACVLRLLGILFRLILVIHYSRVPIPDWSPVIFNIPAPKSSGLQIFNFIDNVSDSFD
jgi:hypothetical protein